MTDTATPIPVDTRKSILADYDKWSTERERFAETDGYADGPSSSEWANSDDYGSELADRFASLLATDSASVAQDLATDALKHLIRLHLAASTDGDNHELAFALNGVIRDALSETLDADSTDPVAHTPRADLVMDQYPSWPAIEDALDDARAMSRDNAA